MARTAPRALEAVERYSCLAKNLPRDRNSSRLQAPTLQNNKRTRNQTPDNWRSAHNPPEDWRPTLRHTVRPVIGKVGGLEESLTQTSMGRVGIEPTLLVKERLFYRQLGLPSPIDPCHCRITLAGFEPASATVEASPRSRFANHFTLRDASGASGIRTHKHGGLSSAAIPISAPHPKNNWPVADGGLPNGSEW